MHNLFVKYGGVWIFWRVARLCFTGVNPLNGPPLNENVHIVEGFWGESFTKLHFKSQSKINHFLSPAENYVSEGVNL